VAAICAEVLTLVTPAEVNAPIAAALIVALMKEVSLNAENAAEPDIETDWKTSIAVTLRWLIEMELIVVELIGATEKSFADGPTDLLVKAPVAAREAAAAAIWVSTTAVNAPTAAILAVSVMDGI
jgi:hypothetical protein